MADYASAIAQHTDLPEDQQKKAGQAIGSDMDDEHKNYLAIVIGMLDRKEIDVQSPQTLLKRENYDKLEELSRGMVDAALVNLADQLRQIENFYRSKDTPNASPQLQTMIEHLWQMKNRLEHKYGDVFKL